jgi:hypothetical protein
LFDFTSFSSFFFSLSKKTTNNSKTNFSEEKFNKKRLIIISLIILKDYKELANVVFEARKNKETKQSSEMNSSFLQNFLLLLDPSINGNNLYKYISPNPIVLFHYPLQLEMCITILLKLFSTSANPQGKELAELKTAHHTLLQKLGQVDEKDYNIFIDSSFLVNNSLKNGADSNINLSVKWEDLYYQSPIFFTDIAVNKLDEWTSFKFPKDILSIILEYDRISDERLLQSNVETIFQNKIC